MQDIERGGWTSWQKCFQEVGKNRQKKRKKKESNKNFQKY